MTLDALLAQTIDRATRNAVHQALADTATAGVGPLLYRTSTAADVLDVSQDTIAKLIDDGHLEYVDGVGRGRLVTRESLVAFVEARKTSVHATSSEPVSRVRPSRINGAAA